MQETLARAAGTFTGKPTIITVDIRPKTTRDKWLQKIRIQPRKKVFTIYPITVQNVYRYASKAVLFNTGLLSGEDRKAALLQAIVTHFHDMVYAVAVCLQNNRHEPEMDLLNLIKSEFTPEDMVSVLMVIEGQLNLKDFMNSIILIKSVDVLTPPKMSRDAGETIAPGV